MVSDIRSISQVGTHEPFDLQVARGQIPGHSVRNIFGHNSDIGTEYRTPWELADTAALPVPSQALVMTIVSTDDEDDGLPIYIGGVDADYNLIFEVVELQGTTPVNTQNSYLFVNDMFVTSDGGQNEQGNITASNGGTVYVQITAGAGRTERAAFMVPAGYSFYLLRIDAYSATATGSSKYVLFRNRSTFPDGRNWNNGEVTFNNNLEVQRQLPFRIGEKTLIQFQGAASSTTADIGIFAEGFLVREQGPL